MYNNDTPKRADLPSSAQLIKSALIAACTAMVLLFTVVMPSEYAIDPTGIGGALGLTKMGEIKVQLAGEAAAAASAESSNQVAATPSNSQVQSEITERLDRIESLLRVAVLQLEPSPVVAQPEQTTEDVIALPAQETMPKLAEASETPGGTIPQAGGKQDETTFTLTPGQGAEIKLIMKEGDTAKYSWSTTGGVVNFDVHGDGGGQNISYSKGRSVDQDSGVIQAAFNGNHGWFWRNRTASDVTVSLKAQGDYSELKRMK
ncbi:MAG: hypothetical protein ACYC10_18855 [Allorhizobium sp.]